MLLLETRCVVLLTLELLLEMIRVFFLLLLPLLLLTLLPHPNPCRSPTAEVRVAAFGDMGFEDSVLRPMAIAIAGSNVTDPVFTNLFATGRAFDIKLTSLHITGSGNGTGVTSRVGSHGVALNWRSES